LQKTVYFHSACDRIALLVEQVENEMLEEMNEKELTETEENHIAEILLGSLAAIIIAAATLATYI
jgi:hypothetical protein